MLPRLFGIMEKEKKRKNRANQVASLLNKEHSCSRKITILTAQKQHCTLAQDI